MSSFWDYIRELEELKGNAENQIIANIPDIKNQALEAVLEWVDSTLEIKKGNIVASAETINILNEFDSNYMKVMRQLELYQGSVTQYLKELKPIGELMADFQKSTNKINVADAGVGDAQKLVVNEILNAYTSNGMNAEIVQPLRNILYQNISSGASMKDTKEQLADFIKGSKGKPGKVERYLVQTAQQGVDSYTGIINKMLMDTIDYNALIMSGSLIDTSSKQCVYGIDILGGLITAESFEKQLKSIAEKNGLVKETTFKNLPFNKLHWGCRHEFTPMFAKEGDQVGANEEIKYGKIVPINNEVSDEIKREVKKKILTADPLLIGPTKHMYDVMKAKVAPLVRKSAMDKFLKQNEHSIVFINKQKDTKVFVVKGASYDTNELETFIKLTNAKQHVIVPNNGAFPKGNNVSKNDAFIIDNKTYLSKAVDLKRIQGGSQDAFKAQMGKAGSQASNVVIDITASMSKRKLVDNLKSGWNDELKSALVNYRGQWYEIDKNILFDEKRIFNLLK